MTFANLAGIEPKTYTQEGHSVVCTYSIINWKFESYGVLIKQGSIHIHIHIPIYKKYIISFFRSTIWSPSIHHYGNQQCLCPRSDGARLHSEAIWNGKEARGDDHVRGHREDAQTVQHDVRPFVWHRRHRQQRYKKSVSSAERRPRRHLHEDPLLEADPVWKRRFHGRRYHGPSKHRWSVRSRGIVGSSGCRLARLLQLGSFCLHVIMSHFWWKFWVVVYGFFPSEEIWRL